MFSMSLYEQIIYEQMNYEQVLYEQTIYELKPANGLHSSLYEKLSGFWVSGYFLRDFGFGI